MPYFSIRFVNDDEARCYTTESDDPIEGKLFQQYAKRIRALSRKYKVLWWGFYPKPVGNVLGNLWALNLQLESMEKEIRE